MDGSPIKILLVEDNPADARFVREVLREVEESAYELTHVALLSDAIRALGEIHFDVVLLDLSLPDTAGVDTVIHLQNEAPQMPIVVLTGLQDDRTAMYAVRIGAQDYVVKGELDGRLLVRTIRYAIERKRMQQLQARYQDQAALNSLAIAVSQSLQLEELLEIAIEKVLEVSGCEMAYIRLRNMATGQISLAAHRGLAPEHIDSLLQPDRPVAKRDDVFRSGEIQVGNGSMPITSGGQTVEPCDRLIVRVPLKAKGEVVGVLNIETRRRTSFSKRQLELLKAIGNVLGVGLDNARLFTETRRQLDRIEALRDISVATATSLNLSRVLKILLDKIVSVLPYSAIDIQLVDQTSGALQSAASWNIESENLPASNAKTANGSGLSTLVFESKRALAIRRVLDDPRTQRPESFRRLGLVSYLGLPMNAHGEAVGVLSVYTKFEHAFAEEEIRFLAALANQAGMAIKNSQLFERIRGQAAELERSNKVKDEFLSVMSHEFRTPLNIILGYCDLMQRGTLGEINHAQEQALGKITDRSNALLAMLSAILEVTRIETEAVSLSCETFNLNDFVGDVRTAYDMKLEKNVAFEWRVPDNAVTLTTDRGKLRLVVDQLLSNAIHFTDTGKITVAASPADDDSIRLSVADTGVGIPVESHDVIFEKFTQLDSSSTRAHEGIGLGLYMVRKFVELMGGAVRVDSQVGVGSVFQVTLPVNGPERPLMAER